MKQSCQYLMKPENQNLMSEEITHSETNPFVHSNPVGKVLSSPSLNTKSHQNAEASFNIYGYQPYAHTYITPAQLKAREENQNQGSDLSASRLYGMPATSQQPFSSCEMNRSVNPNPTPYAAKQLSPLNNNQKTHDQFSSLNTNQKSHLSNEKVQSLQNTNVSGYCVTGTASSKSYDSSYNIVQEHLYHASENIESGNNTDLSLSKIMPSNLNLVSSGTESTNVISHNVTTHSSQVTRSNLISTLSISKSNEIINNPVSAPMTILSGTNITNQTIDSKESSTLFQYLSSLKSFDKDNHDNMKDSVEIKITNKSNDNLSVNSSDQMSNKNFNSTPCISIIPLNTNENQMKRKLNNEDESQKRPKAESPSISLTISESCKCAKVSSNSIMLNTKNSEAAFTISEISQKQKEVTTQSNTLSSNNLHSGFLDSFRSFVNSTQNQDKKLPIVTNKKKRKKAVQNSNFTSEESLSSSSIISTSSSNSSKIKKKGKCAQTNKEKQDSSDDARCTPSPTPSNSSQYSGSSCSNDGGGGDHKKVKKTWLQRHSEHKDNKNASDDTKESVLPKRLPVRKSRNKNSENISNQNDNNKSQDSESSDNEKSSSQSDPEASSNTKKTGYRKTQRSRNIGSNIDKYKQFDRQLDSMEEASSSEEETKDKTDFPYGGTARKKRGRRCGRPAKGELHKLNSQHFDKRTHAHYKRTGDPFLQDGPCLEIAPKLPKCRECRIRAQHRTKMNNIFCRFFAFRKLYYGKNGSISIAGFSQPSDATQADLKLWLPPVDNPPANLDVETSSFLLTHVGDQFCDLVQQEKEARLQNMAEDKTDSWKRVVQGVREMCDVCETTLFNFHWVCHKCGFVVCLDCYKARKNGTAKEEEPLQRNHDEYQWLYCSNHQPHEQDKLMMTNIIASSALWDVSKIMHDIKKKWNIQAHCTCSLSNDEPKEKPVFNGICKQLMSAVSKTFDTRKESTNTSDSQALKKHEKVSVNKLCQGLKQENLGMYNEVESSPLTWLADVALNSSGKIQDNQANKYSQDNPKETVSLQTCTGESLLKLEDKNKYNFSSLCQLIKSDKKNNSNKPEKGLVNSLDDIILYVIEQKMGKSEGSNEEKLLKHFSRRYPQPRNGHEPLPIRICTLTESRLLFPSVPHSWLCNGKLLLLEDPNHVNNLKIFQEQWKRGQPVLVAGVSSKLDMSLWHPDCFCRDFGDIKNDLVNCKTGIVLPDLPMRKFWEGFENFRKRMTDEDGEYMLLKLKDWPPGEDFSEMLPSRFQDLMKVLPLPQYTHRDGVFNLAGRLPECFVRPDLGPKMYNAYGSALYPTKGTTNLHLDISDAVNVMVYVGIPNDGKDEVHIQEALKAIDEGGCDSLMRKRVREKNVKPGALWHIFNARDADKIRDLLNKVAMERGERLEPHHDPIHDQSWYLDEELRDRLYKEYGVEGYAIGQCLGDAVFIPAGAPHQVRNLHSCIKVAEDFVSPENVAHCFTLTQEFRQLSDTHTNHEDKLQIKNIIYHTVKDALALLQTKSPGDTQIM
ncbi:lysine-specific demethylase 3A-like [Centruroides sculpturatus]|uniref:lysine-specific demethylase 3A-like n=1 Tax=Centruroides sculpturatus TaxID=218467 RepID=UPI000C6E093D|nr:lysine-specific demethylase 3A-like [Centruroides sculpturatus]